MALSTRDKVRLEIGDVDTTNALFSDEELDYFLTEESDDILLSAARACDALARTFAREFDFATDGQSFSRGQRAKQYAALAKELRQRAAGVTTAATTRQDGYSDDVAYDEFDGASNTPGRVRQGWFDPDIPF